MNTALHPSVYTAPNTHPSEETLISLVSENGLLLSTIPADQQTEAICLAAVQDEPLALRFAAVQTAKVCLAAVQANPWALDFVKGQTEEICLAAVTTDPMALLYVREQTEIICLAAVARLGSLLELVKHQTLTICRAAIKADKSAKRFAKIKLPLFVGYFG